MVARQTPFVVFAIALATIFRASPGLAQGADTAARSSARRGARITWVRGIDAESCVGQAGLEEDVKSRLGYDAFALPAELAIEGTIVRALPTGFRAELLVRDANGKLQGSRQLASRAADCRSLGEAVAVAITVAIDPDAPGTPATPGPIEPPPSAEPVPRPLLAEERDAARLPRVEALVTGGVSAGVVPSPAAVVALRVHAAIDARVSIGVGAHFWPSRETGGIGVGITSASVDACAVPFAATPFVRWCAAVHVGAFAVAVHDPRLAPVEVGAFPWVAGETGPAVSIPISGGFHLEAAAAAIVPLTRRQAFVRGQPAPVWEQSVVGFRGDLGVGAAF